MKLVGYFPEYSTFSRAQMGRSAREKHRRLTLAVPHVVSSSIAAKERMGQADIHYNFDFAEEATFVGDMTVEGGHFIGIQSADYLHSQLQELRPRTAYAVEHVANGKFDLRAFLFVLGAAAAGGAGPCAFETPRRPAGYKTLSTGWMVPNVGELTVGPNLAQTADQFVTLLALAGAAGVSTVTFLTDFIPGTRGNMLTGRALSKFAIRVAMNMLHAAQECICYAAHRVAFECGKSSVMTLHAHSDEGGWIRGMLRSPSYPPSVGIVSCMGREFLGFPLQESIDPNETLRVVVAGFLEVVALLHPADVLVNGATSFYEKCEGGLGRPSDYDTFVNDASSVLQKWRELISDLDGVHHDSTSDIGAWQAFFDRDRVDRHFGAVKTLIPWWWVEPSPLITMEINGYYVPCKHGAVVTMPLFHATNVHHDSPVLDGKGRCMPNSRIWVERNGGGFRTEGASYILSARYHPDNGLAQFVNVDHLDGSGRSPLGFVDNGTVNLSDMRWLTPHNPIAHPLEGVTNQRSTFMMHATLRSKDPTPLELLEGKVESRLGTFRIVTDSPDVETVTHRDVPRHIALWLKKNDFNYPALTPLKIVSLRAAPSVPSVPVDVVETSDPTGEPLAATHITDPDSAEHTPENLTATPADGGVKPSLPTVKTQNADDRSGNGDPNAT